MPPSRFTTLTVTALAAAAALAGCQHPRVIDELPMDPLISPSAHSPAAKPRVAVRKPVARPVRRTVPAGWIPPVAPRAWKWIVLHHSASDRGSAALFDEWHRARGWDELGYHFVITNGHGGRDGAVEVGGRWTKQKWGAHCKVPGNAYNERGIGICLVGDFEDHMPSAAQLASLARLVEFLCARYDIDPANVIGHRDAPGAHTACPGACMHRYLDVTLRPYLRRRSDLARGR